jgi:hypothetical protein
VKTIWNNVIYIQEKSHTIIFHEGTGLRIFARIHSRMKMERFRNVLRNYERKLTAVSEPCVHQYYKVAVDVVFVTPIDDDLTNAHLRSVVGLNILNCFCAVRDQRRMHVL